MIFYLGTHHEAWLKRLSVPLFISRRQIIKRKTMPRSRVRWALDSGGFTEIKDYGRWTIGPKEFVAQVRRLYDEVGMMDWSGVQNWMCEPEMLKKSGLSIREHQRRTLISYQECCELDASIPWVPILQGWTTDDYLRHLEMYDNAGIDLKTAPLVGVGSVCRRKDTWSARVVGRLLAAEGLRLHMFGVKADTLRILEPHIASADSMAWSWIARRRQILLPECVGIHSRCNNCPRFALKWRNAMLSGQELFPSDDKPQRGLFDSAGAQSVCEDCNNSGHHPTCESLWVPDLNCSGCCPSECEVPSAC